MEQIQQSEAGLSTVPESITIRNQAYSQLGGREELFERGVTAIQIFGEG